VVHHTALSDAVHAARTLLCSRQVQHMQQAFLLARVVVQLCFPVVCAMLLCAVALGCMCVQAYMCVVCVWRGPPWEVLANGWLAFLLTCCCAACVSSLSSCFVSIAHAGTSNCRHVFCTVRMHAVVAHSLLACCRPLHVLWCASTDAVRVMPHNKSGTSWVLQMWLRLLWAWFVLPVRVLLSLHRVHAKQARCGVLNCHNRCPGTCAFVFVRHCLCGCCQLLVRKQLGSGAHRAWACPVERALPEAVLHEVCFHACCATLSWACALQHAQCVGVSAMLPHNTHLFKGGATCLGLHWLGTQELSPAASFEAALFQLCCL
jgi:hypothetical protein